jgi:ABC-2 type transport system permease protein
MQASFPRKVWAIYKRETRQYFVSPIAYLVTVAILLLLGIYFNADLQDRTETGLPPRPTAVLQAFAFLMVFFAPLLTMRLFAEEAREGTLELMLTAPVRDVELVLGKFFGAWTFYTIILALTLVYQGVLLSVTEFAAGPIKPEYDYGSAVAGYIGIWLFGGATISIGMMFSSMTDNQIIAAFLSMAVLFGLWIGDLAGLLPLPAAILNTDIVNGLRVISLQSHYSTSFVLGIILPEDVYFFLAIMFVMLFVTTRLLEARRWR